MNQIFNNQSCKLIDTIKNVNRNDLDYRLKKQSDQKAYDNSSYRINDQKYLPDKKSPTSASSYNIATTSIQSRNSAPSIYIYDQVYDKNNLKRLLAQEYQNTVKNKQNLKQIQRQRERELERQILMKSALIDKKRQLQNLDKQVKTKNIFMQEYYKSQQLKQIQKHSEFLQKSSLRQSLQLKLNHENPFADPSIQKKNYFKEFYNNYNQQSALNDRMYLQNVWPNYKKKQEEIQKITYGGLDRLNQKYRMIEENKKQEEIRKKQELKQTLKNQIKEKQQLKRNYSESKLTNFQIIDYLNEKQRYQYYDTIKNPANLGLNPENKYIINDVRKLINRNSETDKQSVEKDFKNRQSIKKMSLLARSGSQILF